MSELKIDARGMLCPKPLIMTKKALEKAAPGDKLEIMLDNATSRDNVMRFLQDLGCNPDNAEKDGIYTVCCTAVAVSGNSARPEEYCRVDDGRRLPYVLVINRQYMGSGSEELGRILMQACINSIRETNPLPSSILFYNQGVTLACENSPVLAALKELESRGIKILVCGTCRDYCALKPSLQIGRVSNMYDIMQTVASAGTVFAP